MSRQRIGKIAMSLLVVAIGATSATVAYAWGPQRHQLEAWDHGCMDFGCFGSTNKNGDFIRQGFIDDKFGFSDYMNVEVWDAETNTYKVRGHCSNCSIVSKSFDTSPKRECEFKTWHVVVMGNDTPLNGHWHWTASATSGAGC